MIINKISELSKFYSEIGERFDLFYTVEKGTFVSGSIKYIYEGLNFLFLSDELNNLISKNETFLDTGSGDGRICAIANLLELKSYGIEFHEDIASASIQNIDNLISKGILQDKIDLKPVIVRGDFFDDSTYNKLNITFDEIKVFYNFVTYHDQLAQKIAHSSPSGTILIIHSPCPANFSFKGLTLIKEVPLPKIYHVLYVFKKE
jgi:hypothetical protein